jgi:ribosomal protein S18 acetylase RimI-like enzyme
MTLLETVILRDKRELERFFRNNVFLHLYSIGDLDEFFWQNTTWYALKRDNEILAVALFYTGLELPTLLAFSERISVMEDLLQSILNELPERLYAHLSPGLEAILGKRFTLEPHGEHYKMALRNGARLDEVDCSQVVQLSVADLDELQRFYRKSYPENWFDPRMLETGQYFGLRRNGGLISAGGIHVYSEKYRVAALGNITTHPEHRNMGYARLVTARLCQSLCDRVDHIGLNVKADNAAAIACYRVLGFEICASYGEYMAE